MLKIRRPLGRLIFNMGIAIPGKTVFLIETAPSLMSQDWCVITFVCKQPRILRADSRFAPSQWETALLCNDVSHWLSASLESALMLCFEAVACGIGPYWYHLIPCCSVWIPSLTPWQPILTSSWSGSHCDSSTQTRACCWRSWITCNKRLTPWLTTITTC